MKRQLMQHNEGTVLPIEKIMSVISYFTMGIFGLILCIIARVTNNRLKYFLMYNIKQSVIIGVLLFLFGITVKFVFFVVSLIPFLDFVVAILNLILFLKIITIAPLGLSFSFFQLCVFLLLLYLSFGVCIGKNLNVFYLTKLTQNMMKKYQKH